MPIHRELSREDRIVEKMVHAIEDSTDDPAVIDAICRNLNLSSVHYVFWRVGHSSMRWGMKKHTVRL